MFNRIFHIGRVRDNASNGILNKGLNRMNNKYKYLLVIQQYYDPGYGWEDVSEYDKKTEYKDWKHDIREYKLMGYPTRTINRRIKQNET